MPRRRANGEGSLFQRNNGSWCVQISLVSGKRLTKTFKMQRDAKAWMVQTLKTQQDGILVDARHVRFGDFLGHWLEDVVRPSVRPKTLESYGYLVRLHIKPALGAVNLQSLRPAILILSEWGQKGRLEPG